MLYGTISEGYRRGGTNAVPTSGNFAEDPGWLNYGSDSVTNYEIGVKGRTDTMQFSAAVFYVDWKDIQINTATTNWRFFSAANAGGATTKGIEIEMDGYLNENWHYCFGYAFVDAKLDDGFFAPDPSATASAVQIRVPIYTSSLERWRCYEKELETLRNALESGGIKIA